MCPRPEGWTDEQWRAYKDRRGGRMLVMAENMGIWMATGLTQSEAWNRTEEAIMSGALDLEKDLDKATERFVTARKERYGY